MTKRKVSSSYSFVLNDKSQFAEEISVSSVFFENPLFLPGAVSIFRESAAWGAARAHSRR